MKITASQIALESSHEAYQHYHAEESLQASVTRGDQSVDLSFFHSTDISTAQISSYQLLGRTRPIQADRSGTPHPGAAEHPRPRIPPAAAHPAHPVHPPHPDHSGTGSDPDAGLDADLLLIKLLLEYISGREINILHVDINTDAANAASPAPSAPAAQPATQFSIDYSFSEVYQESESTTVHASGTVQTAAGTDIAFDISLLMQRSYSTSTQLTFHAGNRKDPLIINLDGGSANLGTTRYAFDLDGDGQTEAIAFATGASAFLAIDRNADGIVNNGGELFGTQSGNGFADLASYDEDSNGFIDAGDAVFARLLAFNRNAEGIAKTATLQSLGVGALYLGSTASPFELRGVANEALGTVRASGIFLNEDSSVGTLQQVDLVV